MKIYILSVLQYSKLNEYCQGELVEPGLLSGTRLRHAANDMFFKRLISNFLQN